MPERGADPATTRWTATPTTPAPAD
jgi:hypothetical protein